MDDSDPLITPGDFYLFSPATDGTIYVTTEDGSDGAFSSTYNYDIFAIIDDDYPAGQFGQVDIALVTTGTFEFLGDQDSFSLQVTEGFTYEFVWSNVILAVVDEFGTLLDYSFGSSVPENMSIFSNDLQEK